MGTESEYWHSYTILSKEVDDIVESFYTEKEINDYASKNNDAFSKMNDSALFWTVTTHALQTTFIITLGRVFDTDRRSHSIQKLLNETVAHPEFFSRQALRCRKLVLNSGLEPDWLADRLNEAWEPNTSGLKELRNALSPSLAKYNAAFAPIRHKLYAHREVLDTSGTQGLVDKGLIVDLEKILYVLHDLLQCIFQLAHNGERPCPGARQYDYENRVRSTTRKALSSLIG